MEGAPGAPSDPQPPLEGAPSDALLQIATILSMRRFTLAVGQLAGASRAIYLDRELWKGFSQLRGPLGRTRLMHAARVGSAARAEFLLALGADVNARGAEGVTALGCACKRGHLEVARMLLERGAHAGAGAGAAPGTSPLMLACAGGHVECARLLLECGAAGH